MLNNRFGYIDKQGFAINPQFDSAGISPTVSHLCGWVSVKAISIGGKCLEYRLTTIEGRAPAHRYPSVSISIGRGGDNARRPLRAEGSAVGKDHAPVIRNRRWAVLRLPRAKT